ncbi:hypothetical protein BSPWISOXPB_1111 [uncultured Gammaproteobacteria bacterium]|nr:hypothetical protein BSPWISOXPB_1111 [uncultured Gammaproteobacteria bacterium]
MLGVRLGVVGILAREDVKVLLFMLICRYLCCCVTALFALFELTAYLHGLEV